MRASLLALLSKADAGEDIGRQGKASILRELRKSKLRRPDVVLKFQKDALANKTGEADELNLLEQISLAAMDVGEGELASSCIDKLSRRFKTSVRVDRLKGMKLESEGKYDQALELYTEVLKTSPSNLLVMKRIVCVYRQQGKIAEAVEQLHKILKLFASDGNTWNELAEIHISRGEYVEAAHCLEEVLLLDPECAHAHARLADTYYTIGDQEHLLLARKHYTMSLNRQNAQVNLRALYGLMASCRALLALPAPGVDASQKELCSAMLEQCRESVSDVNDRIGHKVAFALS